MAIKLPQKVNIKWNGKNKNYLVNKGYTYTKMGDNLEINVEDLTQGSSIKVKYLCDYCGKEIEIPFKKIKYIEKIPCKQCIKIKVKETCLKKYGVENTTQLKEVQYKMKQTCLEKYGVENPLQCEQIKNKVKETNMKKYGSICSMNSKKIKEEIKQNNMKKYGVENYSQTKEYKTKCKQTCLEKYGVEYAFQAKEVKQKIKQTHLKHYGIDNNMKSVEGYNKYKQSIIKKYGVDNIAKAKIVKQHIRESLYKNGTAPCSKQQKYLCDLLEGKLNYPVDYFSLDIAFPDKMIYVEYDGSGHNLRVKRGNITEKQFKKEEINRKLYLQRKGWKIIRIISKQDKLLSDEKILELYDKANNYLLNSKHTWVEIDIDNNEYKCKEYTYKI